MTHARRTLAGLSAALWLASCGGGAAQPTEPTGGVPSPPTPWGQMSRQQKQEWMFSEVEPRMDALFSSHDAARYSDFGCETCHGPAPEERGYEMPSASLPALYDTGTPEQRQMSREYPEMVRFMFNQVLPTMQTLLGAPDYDEETGEGFSCYACHPHAGDPGTTPVHLESPPAEAAPPDAGAEELEGPEAEELSEDEDG